MFDELFEAMESTDREVTLNDDELFNCMVGLMEVGDMKTANKLYRQIIEEAEAAGKESDESGGVSIGFDDDDEKPLWEKQRDGDVDAFVLESEAVDVAGFKIVLAESPSDAKEAAITASVPYSVWGTMDDLYSQLGEVGQVDFTTLNPDSHDNNEE